MTTSDAALADRVRMLRNYGSKEKISHHELKGVNSRVDELQAAFLRAKLRKLDEWNQRRKAMAATYLNELSEVSGVRKLCLLLRNGRIRFIICL